MASAGDSGLPAEETSNLTRDASGPASDASLTNHPAVEKPVHDTLKYSLLGPSLLKAGQESVDQAKVSDIIYNASKGSKYFDREEEKDKILSLKIDQILAKKAQLERQDLSRDLRLVDSLIAQLDSSRDLSQYIVHVDCDAFYAAVELLDRPELADVPFAVGGGVLSTCNYVARKFGCRSGMAGFVAKKLCPQLVVLPPDFPKYNAKAQEVRQILADYDPRFESASIDEAYLNITQYCAAHDTTPAAAVEKLRKEIAEKTKVTVSAGIAANTRLAKICSNMNKPNGQFLLPNNRGAVVDFIRALPCRKVNGIGRVFERELAAVGIKTCGDIFEQRMFLRPLFGDKACHFLVQAHLGLGRTRIQPAEESERKSVGTESTFPSMSEPDRLRQKLQWTAEELERDLRRASCRGRTLVLKIKLHTFEVITRQAVAPRALLSAGDLYGLALPMLAKVEQEIPDMKVRLMGLRCTHLVSTRKPDTQLFFGMRLSPDTVTAGGEGPEDPVSANQADYAGATEGASNGSERPTWPGGAQSDLLASSEGLGPCRTSGHQGGTCPPAALPPRSHGKVITPNPKGSGTTAGTQPAVPEEWWSCPVCLRARPADERQFNEHIDACLSRRAILEAVHESASEHRAPSDANAATGRKKRRPMPAKTAGMDPRQKKICFGAP